jgi:hypothetical protein
MMVVEDTPVSGTPPPQQSCILPFRCLEQNGSLYTLNSSQSLACANKTLQVRSCTSYNISITISAASIQCQVAIKGTNKLSSL